MTQCKCFTCQHRDQPELCAAYWQGYVDACDWFLNWARRNKIPEGHIADNDLPGIVAQMQYNRDESAYLLNEVKEMLNDKTPRDKLPN